MCPCQSYLVNQPIDTHFRQRSMLAAEQPSFFSRLNTYDRSKSYDSSTVQHIETEGGAEAESSDAGANIRRSASLRTDTLPRTGIEGLSFSAAGASLSLDAPPPLASRHALFSHHRVVSTPVPMTDAIPITQPAPPSPTLSSSSSAFSPASAFLSRFSSTGSSRPPSSLATPDGPGAVVLGYTLGKVLGRGGFSTVRLATNSRGESFACKIVKRDDLSDRSGSLEKFEEEIRILQSLPRHPSLLPLLEMERTNYATFLITPALLGGNLLDVLRREGGSDKTARKWFPGVVAAVSAMHEGYDGFAGGMLHGDLKLDNFLVDHEGRVVACDFYMAHVVSAPPVIQPTQHRRPRATLPTHLEPIGLPAHFPSASLPYAPPELISHPPSPPTLAQDIWALGVVLYALLMGKLPFVDAFDPRLQMKILRGQWDRPDHLGREWVEVLQGCLDGNRSTRWTIDRVKKSDAVVGWKEVKQRSSSRSRSRMRADEWADPLTSRPRDGRSASRGPAGRGNGDTRSRSRSTIGRNRLEPEEIGFSHLHVRGRSPHNKFTAAPPGAALSLARTSRPTSATRNPSANRDGQSTPTSRSRSTGRQSPLAPLSQSHSPDNGMGMNIGQRGSGQSAQAHSFSPTDSMEGKPRSRSRTPWGEGRSLGVVDEESTGRGRRGWR